MIDYRQKINSIYNKSKESSISDNRFVEILELFCEYCQTFDIEGLTTDKGQYLSVLVDSVEKAMKYYKPENVDFFFYTLKIIKLDIRQAKKEEYDSIKSVIDIPESTKRQAEKDMEKIKDVANYNCINIYKINDTEIKIISKETGLDIDRINNLLNQQSLKITKPFEQKENDKSQNNDGIPEDRKQIEKNLKEEFKNSLNDTYEIEKQDQKQQQESNKRYFSTINDVYMFLSPTKKHTYKVVLVNFFIDSMFDDNTDIEKMETILKQFKFYDETDNRINQVVKDFIKTGKSKTQEELAKIINLNKDTISKIQRHFKELLREKVTNKDI